MQKITKKVAHCPHCKKQIESLIRENEAIEVWKVYPKTDNISPEFLDTFWRDNGKDIFYCSICDKKITDQKIINNFRLSNFE